METAIKTAMEATGRPQEGHRKATGRPQEGQRKATGFSPKHRTEEGKTRSRGNIIYIILLYNIII